jgi:tripartite-type tricarboxylate transporter receptor subunit TctC
VIGGQVSLGIDVTNEWVQLSRSGRLRILGTSGSQRSKVVPEIPTFSEQGFPGIVGSGWFAMYASNKASSSSIKRINEAMNLALAQPDVVAKFLSLGYEPGGGSPSELEVLMKSDARRWQPVVQASGVRVN